MQAILSKDCAHQAADREGKEVTVGSVFGLPQGPAPTQWKRRNSGCYQAQLILQWGPTSRHPSSSHILNGNKPMDAQGWASDLFHGLFERMHLAERRRKHPEAFTCRMKAKIKILGPFLPEDLLMCDRSQSGCTSGHCSFLSFFRQSCEKSVRFSSPATNSLRDWGLCFDWTEPEHPPRCLPFFRWMLRSSSYWNIQYMFNKAVFLLQMETYYSEFSLNIAAFIFPFTFTGLLEHAARWYVCNDVQCLVFPKT